MRKRRLLGAIARALSQRLAAQRPRCRSRKLRALNSPGSGMSDAHRPVYWLRGSTRHARPSQELSQWLATLSGRCCACARRYSCRDSPVSGLAALAAFPWSPLGHRRAISESPYTDSPREIFHRVAFRSRARREPEQKESLPVRIGVRTFSEGMRVERRIGHGTGASLPRRGPPFSPPPCRVHSAGRAPSFAAGAGRSPAAAPSANIPGKQ